MERPNDPVCPTSTSLSCNPVRDTCPESRHTIPLPGFPKSSGFQGRQLSSNVNAIHQAVLQLLSSCGPVQQFQVDITADPATYTNPLRRSLAPLLLLSKHLRLPGSPGSFHRHCHLSCCLWGVFIQYTSLGRDIRCPTLVIVLDFSAWQRMPRTDFQLEVLDKTFSAIILLIRIRILII